MNVRARVFVCVYICACVPAFVRACVRASQSLTDINNSCVYAQPDWSKLFALILLRMCIYITSIKGFFV